MNDTLKVLVLAAEAVPFAKVGGLAEVAGSLPKALRKLDVDARLMIPRYGGRGELPYEVRRIGSSIPVPVGRGEGRIHLLETTTSEVPIYLIWDDQYFSKREKVYGFNDDPQRFVFFSRAVLAALQAMDWKPDVIHANDWHTAAVPTWLDVYGRDDPTFKEVATLYTIHNLAYQGECGRLLLTFGKMPDVPHLPVEPPGKVNWMAQGIKHADVLSTVSPTYAREIITETVSGNLASLLRERQDNLFGILSGIDTEAWNPAQDTALTQTYDSASLKMRAVNKLALQRELHLPTRGDIPLLGVVSRLDRNKGLSLLPGALEQLLPERDVQLVVLGTGDETCAAQFQSLQERYPDHVRAILRFDDRLSRWIYGGVDMFVMPSLFDPISISTMTALHYGAVPVVRATGGLADTVVDADRQPQRGTGFVFEEYSETALHSALRRALAALDDPARWEALQTRGMELDLSWDASARAYADLYRRARGVHHSA